MNVFLRGTGFPEQIHQEHVFSETCQESQNTLKIIIQTYE